MSPSSTIYFRQNILSPRPSLGIKNYLMNDNVHGRRLQFGTCKRTSPSSPTIKVRCTKVEPPTDQKGLIIVPIFEGLEPAVITPPKDLRREDFPPTFKFGASTSALQTEGDGTEGGRGPSTWDFMIRREEGYRATDSYKMYKEDVKLLKNMGMDSYRFSISWSRLLPDGVGDTPNPEGIKFYNDLIQELIGNGIEPVATLFHFDLPVAIQNMYDGFLSERIIDDFKNYAEICFREFGDRVKYWSTINEPYSYAVGNNSRDPLSATHNILLAHAAAAEVYHEKYQIEGGKIGLALPCQWFEPQSNDPKDVLAAQRQLDFLVDWYMHPLFKGDYPDSIKYLAPVKQFSDQQQEMLKKSCDYIGLNYYTSRYSKGDFTVNLRGLIQGQYTQEIVDAEGKLIGPQCSGQPNIFVYPPGMKNLLLYITKRYDKPEIVVMENGVPDAPIITESVQSAIANKNYAELSAAFLDDYRISHAELHLIGIREAMKEGANVTGYFVWTLMDNMEVGVGYECRFGLNFTDFKDDGLRRYRKKSSIWYEYFLKGKFD